MGLFGIGNIVKIGGLLVAGILGYTLLKNAGTIGTSVGTLVGGGISQGIGGLGYGLNTSLSGLQESLVKGFAGINIFGGSPNPDTGGAGSQDDPNQIVDPPESQRGNTDPSKGVVSPDPNLDYELYDKTAFGGFVDAGTVSRQFAEAYSFQPPARSGQLDVSKTFAYISSTDYRNNQEQNALSGSGFGGYGSSQAQTDALASAISESAEKYPEWFA